MIIAKEFHFHAAHRNLEFGPDEKCGSLHGHTYHVTLFFASDRKEKSRSVTTPFVYLDKAVKDLCDKFDHALLIDLNDKVLTEAQGVLQGKVLWLDFPTSVENMCFYMFDYLHQVYGVLNLMHLNIKETTSSTVIYDKNDYLNDLGVSYLP